MKTMVPGRDERVMLLNAAAVGGSEKALKVEVQVARADGQTYPRILWLPKSQIEVRGNEIWIAPWLFDAKSNEVSGLIARTIDGKVSL